MLKLEVGMFNVKVGYLNFVWLLNLVGLDIWMLDFKFCVLVGGRVGFVVGILNGWDCGFD